MLKRHVRERREYIIQQQLKIKELVLAQKKEALKKALATGKTALKEIIEDEKLHKDFLYDENHEIDLDNEYSSLSGIINPKILLTTSRDPSNKLMQFLKEIKMFFPESIRLNRGNYIISNLIKTCLSVNISDLVILHEHRGVPTSLSISHFPHGPSCIFTLHNIKMRHDLRNQGNVSECYPHIIFENFTTDLGKRVVEILKHLFPPGPKLENPRVITFVNKDDYIFVRHHLYVKTNDNVELSEVGPRFEMKLYEIKLGLLNDQTCDTEWKLRRFVRTANRKNYL